ncbi:MAG: hypothetical protein ACI81A_001048 [Paraglaciecola sp.]|jgi:hypothetical protein
MGDYKELGVLIGKKDLNATQAGVFCLISTKREVIGQTAQLWLFGNPLATGYRLNSNNVVSLQVNPLWFSFV